jgi:hypothetical protein
MAKPDSHRFIVIAAEGAGIGRGVRGHALAWFLRRYLGRNRVQLVSPSQAATHCDPRSTVLLGMPTSLAPEVVATLPARQLVAFDYFDQHLPAWQPAIEQVVRQRCQLYLKPWCEPTWDFGIDMGLLPIRRYGRFTAAVKLDRWMSQWRAHQPRYLYDVAIIGRPNATEFYRGQGRVEHIDQRTAWIAEIRRQAPELKFWGGVVEVNPVRRPALEQQFGSLDDLTYRGKKADFATYYRGMQRARVLLAPGGNVPWSYRHYESLYANAVVVTLDYRERDMLIPLPKHGMVHVADGDSVLPAVESALRLLHDRPRLPAENRAFVEQFLHDSDYNRSRKPLIERFLQQFETKATGL